VLPAQLPNPGKYFPLERVALVLQIIECRTNEESEGVVLDRHTPPPPQERGSKRSGVPTPSSDDSSTSLTQLRVMVVLQMSGCAGWWPEGPWNGNPTSDF